MKKEERVKELGGLLQHIANVMASLEKEIKPEPVEHNCDNCKHQPNAVLYCHFQPTECRYYKPKPPEPPEAETAFQGIVRKVLEDCVYGGDFRKSWEYIERNYTNLIERVRTTMNATLDLAMAAIDYKVVPLGSGGSLDKIHALKEPTP